MLIDRIAHLTVISSFAYTSAGLGVNRNGVQHILIRSGFPIPNCTPAIALPVDDKKSWSLSERESQKRVFPFACEQSRTKFVKVCQSLNLQGVSVHQARRSGRSIDRTLNPPSLRERAPRGHWFADQRVQRCEKVSRVVADHFALPRRTRDRVGIVTPRAQPFLESQSVR